MFVLKPYLYFRDSESGKDIPIRLLDEEDPADAKLIRRLESKEGQEQF